MSAGNLKNDRGKGNNHSYQFNSLRNLGAIAAFVGAGATEATLQLVLTAIQSGSEFEARLVEDSDTPAVTWLEVRTWNTTTGTWNPVVYYPPNSNIPGAPVLPVMYINNSSVLATIASNTTGLSTETTLLATNALLTTIDSDTGLILADTNAMVVDLAAIEILQTAIAADTAAMVVDLAAIEVLLTTIDGVLDDILIDTGNIATDTSTLATPVTGLTATNLRVVGAGAASIAAGNRRVTFFNAGTADTTVAGATLAQGEVTTFVAGERDVLASIAYDALTSELLISTVG